MKQFLKSLFTYDTLIGIVIALIVGFSFRYYLIYKIKNQLKTLLPKVYVVGYKEGAWSVINCIKYDSLDFKQEYLNDSIYFSHTIDSILNK